MKLLRIACRFVRHYAVLAFLFPLLPIVALVFALDDGSEEGIGHWRWFDPFVLWAEAFFRPLSYYAEA